MVVLAGLAIAVAVSAGCVGDDPSITSPSIRDGGSNEDGGQTADGAALTCNGACGEDQCFEGVCGGRKVVGLAAGSDFVCAVRTSGSLWCWGRNDIAQLGTLARSDSVDCPPSGRCHPMPAPVPGLEGVVQVAAAFSSACAVTKAGEVFCWGQNRDGKLGVDPSTEACGTVPCLTKPRAVAGVGAAVEVAVGIDVACARTQPGEVYCWGNNSNGQLGIGSTDPARQAAVKVKLARKATGLAVGAGGRAHACVVQDDKTVACWGSNANAQLGRPGNELVACADNRCSPTPILVTSFVPAMQVVAGDGHTCILSEEGKVWCIGYAGYAIGSNPNSHVPRDVGINGATELAGHFRHVCATTSASVIQCLGNSNGGRLGVQEQATAARCFEPDGPSCRPLPVPVVLAANAIDLFDVSVAVRGDGRVLAWGPSAHGLLGHVPSTGDDVSCPLPGGGAGVLCNAVPQAIPAL
jgi:alpha-tubulin suppressor-like RCC1 family protein